MVQIRMNEKDAKDGGIVIETFLSRLLREMSATAHAVLGAPAAERKGAILLVAHVAGTSQRKAKKVLVAMSQLQRKYGVDQ